MSAVNISTDAAVVELTGERYFPAVGGNIALDHLHRYLSARRGERASASKKSRITE